MSIFFHIFWTQNALKGGPFVLFSIFPKRQATQATQETPWNAYGRFYYAIDFQIIPGGKAKDDDDDEKIFRPNRILMKFKMLLAAGLAFYLKERFVLLV